MKEAKETFTTVPVDTIMYESNRKHGGMGNIEVLSGSIKTEGLINPPTVTENEDGTYRVVAGRRRVEAVRQLKWKEVPVRVIGEADAARLESIALAENVNRQETHPLDEAETFKKMLDKGTAVEDIAAYYDRSVSGIRHRARLCDLIDGVKEMFRDGKIALSGAALIAGFPPKDQEKFLKKYGEKGADKWGIYEFLRKAQAFPLTAVADEKCAVCGKRTHNAAPGLFDEEYSGLEDTCLDGECYAGKWQNLILQHIVESGDKENTEHKIILDRSVPPFVSPKTAALDLAGEEYALLAYNKHLWSDTNKESGENTAWLVSVDLKRGVEVTRVSYEKYERPGYGSYNTPSDPVKEYLIDQILDIREEDRKAVAEKVREKYHGNDWTLRRNVKEKLLEAVVTKRLEEGSGENLAALYLARHCSGEDAEGNWREIGNPELFAAIFDNDGIYRYGDIPRNPLIQNLFSFLIIEDINIRDLPDPDDFKPDWDGEWDDLDTALFWKFAGMSKEEYLDLYRGFLAEAVHAAVASKEQKPEEEAPEDGDPDASETAGDEDEKEVGE